MALADFTERTETQAVLSFPFILCPIKNKNSNKQTNTHCICSFNATTHKKLDGN